MILIWFVYGLAFFVLGLAILVYPKKASRFDLARHIWMVGLFGIIHGVNEWLDMFLAIGGPLPPDLMAHARMLTLVGSFFFLVQFGVTILAPHPRDRRLLGLIPPLLLVVWLAILLLSRPGQRLLMGDIWARYLLCAPGTFLTAWGLAAQRSAFQGKRLSAVTRNLALAAVTFLIYGLLAGVCVKKADFFPARLLNYDTFLALTGLPVQIFRAFCAVGAAWSLIRVLDVFRWESQEALRVSELRCATVASAIPVFLFMVDREMVVTFVQGKGLETLGLSPEQIRGRPIGAALGGGESFVEHCRLALSGQGSVATVPLNGVSFEVCFSALQEKTRVVTQVVGVALDVSARMEAQRELEKYRRKVEKHAREAAVGVLSTTVAQHVAEPLTVAQLLLERTVADWTGPDASDAVRRGIGKTLAELSQARETLNRFMEMTHSDAAAAERPLGLYQIAKRTMSVFAESAMRRRMTIAVRNMEVVPLTAVSPREMEQIFYHLIERAIDAADGDREQKLIIGCAAGDTYFELSFCDTCIPIHTGPPGHDIGAALRDAENLDGLGLGLAVVKRIVADRGGQISVEAGTEGTTLRVRLPASRMY